MQCRSILVMVLFALALPAPLLAADQVAILDLGPSYVHEDGRLRLDYVWNWTEDQPILVVGFVSAFHGPLAYLDVSEPGVEYTWTTSDQTSANGILADGTDGCSHGNSLEAKGGRFAILRDTSPDADLSDPSTFADGEVLLEGRFQDLFPHAFSLFVWNSCEGSREETMLMSLFLEGGSAFSSLDPQESSIVAFAGGALEIGAELPQELLDLDYFAAFDATLEMEGHVPVVPTTWGRIKTLYQ